MKLKDKILTSAFIAISTLLIMFGVAYASYDYEQEFIVTDNSGATRSDLIIFTGINPSSYIDADYLNSTGNNSNVTFASSGIPYLLTDNDTLIYVDDLDSYESKTHKFLTGYSPEQTSFPIMVGSGGNVTISDDPSMELSDNFSITFEDVFIDTTAGADKYILYKEGAIELYVDASTSGTINLLLPQRDYDLVYMRPNGNGDQEELSPGTDNYLDVDDPVGAPDGTAVSNSASDWEVDYYEAQNPSALPTGSVISGVWTMCRYEGDTNYSGYYRAGTVVAGNVSYASWQNSPPDAGFHNKTSSQSRPGGGSWTFSDFADLQIYVGGSWGSPGAASIDQIYVYFDYYVPEIECSVSGITTGEYDITISANTTHVILNVGGSSDSEVLVSDGILNNSNDWILFNSDAMLYTGEIEFSIDGSPVATYLPTELIASDTLEDTTGSNDGTIAWGSNPANVQLSYGNFESYDDYYASTETISQNNVGSYAAPDTWEDTGTFAGTLTPELKESIANAASTIGMDEQSFWMMLIFGVAIAVSFGAYLFTGSLLVSGIVMSVALVYGTQTGIIAGGFAFAVGVAMFSLMYLLRHN